MTQAPALSIVIPVYGNWWLTRRCLQALAALAERTSVRFETIVVNNASPDDTVIGLNAFPWIRRIDLPENANFSGGCNAGARVALAPVVLFLNNDATPVGDPLAPLLRAFDDDNVVIAGGVLHFEDGPVQCAGMAMQRGGAWWSSLRNCDPRYVDTYAPPLCPTGAAFAVSREWFHAVGGFSDAYRNGYEDVDLAMRAFRDRKRVEIVKSARFTHYEGASPNRFAFESENERLFYSRWSASLSMFPRVDRGTLGAFVLRDGSPDPLVRASLEALIPAMRALGHSVVARVLPWMALDTRFRRGRRVALDWFTGPHESEASLCVNGETVTVRGALDARVPFLPCVDANAPCALAFDPRAQRIAVIGDADFDGPPDTEIVRLPASGLLGAALPPVALAVVDGLTDPVAYGNVLLASHGIPVLARGDGAKRIFFEDTCAFGGDAGALLSDPRRLVALSSTGRADAQRRFSPARSAQRMVDLGFYALNGVERAATATSNVPDGVVLEQP